MLGFQQQCPSSSEFISIRPAPPGAMCRPAAIFLLFPQRESTLFISLESIDLRWVALK